MKNDYIEEMRARIGHGLLMLAGAGVHLYRDGRLLLQRRSDNGKWADHGGCVDVGEDVADTARRELFEETGITAGALELVGAFSGSETIYTYPNGDKVFYVTVYYVCRDFSGEPTPDPDEVAELRWFPIDKLPPDGELSPPCVRPLRACVEYIKKNF